MRIALVIAAVALTISGMTAVRLREQTARIDAVGGEVVMLTEFGRSIEMLSALLDLQDSVVMHEAPDRVRVLTAVADVSMASLGGPEIRKRFEPITARRWDELSAAWAAARPRPDPRAMRGVLAHADHAVIDLGQDSLLNYDESVEVQNAADLLTHNIPKTMLTTRNDNIVSASFLGKPELSIADRVLLARMSGMRERHRLAAADNLSNLRSADAGPDLLRAGDAADLAFRTYQTALARAIVERRDDPGVVERLGRMAADASNRNRELAGQTQSYIDHSLAARVDRLKRERAGTWEYTLLAVVLGSLTVWLIIRWMARHDRDALRRVELEAEALAAELARVGAERALRLTEAQFRVVFDVAHVGIALFDGDGKLAEANAALALLFGESRDVFLESLRERLREIRSSAQRVIRFEQRWESGGVPAWYAVSLAGVYEESACRLILVMTEEITERKNLEERLRHDAGHDSLTRLANRATFEEAMLKALAGAPEQPFSLLFVDLDYFKEINDTYGHGSGDRVLIAVAERLRSAVAAHDVVARLGGDEFGIIVWADEPETIAAVAERVRSAVRQPVAFEEKSMTLSASIGIAFGSKNHLGIEQLVREADLAMYASKAKGRNRYTFYREGIAAAAGSAAAVHTPIDSDAPGIGNA
jgi:diguanylate cyclase (GGDEF)-like protein/PAS domain S-box-containing protein